ncbi:glycosyltransferase [Clostridium perfringens]|nr:glycosyltransferase [Clostridium perfringens]
MNSLFIANLQLNENEGIYKKIMAQAKGIADSVGKCHLITKNESGSKIYDVVNQKLEKKDISIFDAAKLYIEENDISVIYIRHMIPTFKLLSFLKMSKKKGILIYYEIPTYPYFAEQIRTSRRKHRAIIRLALDIIFWPFIYLNIHHLVIIKSNSKVKIYKKMVEITNGAFIDNIVSKKYNLIPNNIFSMVAVGTLYPYHGYDRVLKGLKNCNERVDGKIVEFNVVGSSDTINDLKKQANNLGLKHVKFLGIKSTEELNYLYEKFDIGLGCLALHRRNADIDTTIKIIEYYCRGVPVVTSGSSPMDSYCEKYTVHVEDSEEPIDIGKIYQQYSKLTYKDKVNISKLGNSIFSWNNIMNKLLKS